MQQLGERTGFLFLTAYLIGVLVGVRLDLGAPILFAGAGVALSGGLIFYRRSAGGQALICALISLTLIAAGRSDRLSSTKQIEFPNRPIEATALIDSSVSIGSNGAAFFDAHICAATSETQHLRRSPLLKIKIDHSYRKWRRGDIFNFRARLRPPPPDDPDRHDYSDYLRHNGYSGSVFISDDLETEFIGRDKPSSVIDTFDSLRNKLTDFIDRNSDRTASPALKAMLLGVRRGMDDRISDSFKYSGLAHLLAVSGLHIGIIAGLIFFLFRIPLALIPPVARRYDANRPAAALTIPAVIAYTALCSAPISAVRAAIMTSVYLFAKALGRKGDALNILALAALAISIYHPLDIFSVSFQLSFTSVLFIILAIDRFGRYSGHDRLPTDLYDQIKLRAKRFLYSTAIVSAAGLFSTAPLVALYFQQFTPIGLLSNLVAAPIFVFMVIPTAFAALVLHPLPFISGPLMELAGFICSNGITLIDAINLIPGSSFSVARPSTFGLFAFYSAGFSLLLIRPMKKSLRVFSAVAAVWILVTASTGAYQYFYASPIITFIDVGAGDSILIEASHGINILVDAGPSYHSGYDAGERIVAPALIRRGIGRIDYLIATHPEADHIGGMRYIVDNFKIGRFFHSGRKSNSPVWNRLLAALKNKQVPTSLLNRGNPPLKLGGLKITPLWPPADGVNLFRNENDAAIVLLVADASGARALIASDITAGAADRLNDSVPLPVDILQAPHHGGEPAATSILLSNFPSSFIVASCDIISGKKIRTISAALESADRFYTTERCGNKSFQVITGRFSAGN